MRENASELVRTCYRSAEDYARKAESERDPKRREHYRTMEARWLLLAHCYEVGGRLEPARHSGMICDGPRKRE